MTSTRTCLQTEIVGGGTLAPATVIRVHATLHRALRDAVRWGQLNENVASRADPPKQKNGLSNVQTWTVEQLRTFLRFVRDEHDRLLWVLLAMTGMRRGEVLGMRWQDIDLDESVLAVRETVVNISGRKELSTPKTSRGRRVVALDVETVDALRSAWECGGRPLSGRIFQDKNGEIMNGCSVSKRFGVLAAAAGLPRIRLHDLRHTHATLALQLGIHPKVVSERLGHSTVAFTLDVYSHAMPHMQAEAADRIGSLVLGETK